MSDTQRTTVTRRRALKSGALAGIAAGLFGAVKEVKAAPAPQPDLATVLCDTSKVVDANDYAAWLDEWRDTDKMLSVNEDEIIDALNAYVPEKQRHDLVGKLVDIIWNRAIHEQTRNNELMFRHLPGLDPMLRLLVMHVWETDPERERKCGPGSCWDGASA